MPKKEAVEVLGEVAPGAVESAIIREPAPAINPALEGRFIRANVMGIHNTVYLVNGGKKYAFTSWQELSDAFGNVPPGGVLILRQAKVDAIPDGGLWKDKK